MQRMTITQIAETSAALIAGLAEPTSDRMDFKAPAADPAAHYARMQAQELYARLAKPLDELERCEVLADLCIELVQALPAMYPWRTPATYEALRGLVRSLGVSAVAEGMRVKATAPRH
jgi:hypothetical protein